MKKLCIYRNISTTALPPWWGGIFEGMVKSVKRCLKKILLSARIPFEELETVLREVELTLTASRLIKRPQMAISEYA